MPIIHEGRLCLTKIFFTLLDDIKYINKSYDNVHLILLDIYEGTSRKKYAHPPRNTFPIGLLTGYVLNEFIN